MHRVELGPVLGEVRCARVGAGVGGVESSRVVSSHAAKEMKAVHSS